jgi:nitrogen fixation NifU-like protein
MTVEELYQDIILEHSKNPKNVGELETPCLEGLGHNRTCGDKIRLHLKICDDTICEAKHCSEGCALSKAAASLMTETIKGMSRKEVLDLADEFCKVMSGKALPDPEKLGELACLFGARRFPARAKCVTLAWRTLQSAIDGEGASPSEDL